MNEWLLILLMALVTFMPRYLPYALAGRFKIPASLERALGFVPIAMLTAIIAQNALIKDGQLALVWHNHHAVATMIAFLTAVSTRHLFATIATGLLTFVLLQLAPG